MIRERNSFVTIKHICCYNTSTQRPQRNQQHIKNISQKAKLWVIF